jgi:alpha-beta hydrolase superfamily lysophospholipase
MSAAPVARHAVLQGELVTYKSSNAIGVQKYKDDGDRLSSEVQLGPKHYTIELSRSAGTVACNGGAPQRLDDHTLALENGDWQAYAVAASRFSAASSPVDVKVLLPCSGRSFAGRITVTPQGSARRVVLEITPLAVSVLVDEQGAVTEASVPLQELTVRRSSQAAPLPPAAEALPAGVTARELSVSRGGIVLKGSAWLPSPTRAGVPVVLMIAGSGPTDRDGNSPLGVHSNTYRMLASELAARGVASVRYDKRGSGGSGLGSAPEALVLDDFVEDALAWIQTIRKQTEFGKLTLLGHSEGGLIAALAAERAPVDALVLLASPGRPLGALVRSQLARQAPPPLLDDYDRITRALRAKQTIDPVPESLAGLFNPGGRHFFASAMDLEPAAELKKVRTGRVTIVQGSTDLQISTEDAKALAAARPDGHLTLVAGMNHVLKSETSLAGPQPSYTDPSRPLAPGLVDAVDAGIVR